MVLPPSFSRKMGEIETVEVEKMGWIYLPRGTLYPTLPYVTKISGNQFSLFDVNFHFIIVSLFIYLTDFHCSN